MKITFKTGKGINRDQLPGELAPGVWSDCQNMRFRDGFDERVGGVAAVFTTPLVAPYWLQTYAVGSASSLTRNLVYCGLAKAYVDDGTTQTEISRYTDKIITNLSFNGGGAGGAVTATTATAHGLSVGNSVTVWGVVQSTSDNDNGTVTVIGVPSATTFTYSAAGGAVPVVYSGLLGQVTVSTSVESFTATADTRWTGGVLGGVLIANSPNDGLFYWNGDTSSKMRRLLNSAASPYTMLADVARVYKNYIILLGRRYAAGVKRPHLISWSAAQEPGSVPTFSGFAASATNDAGEVEKAESAGALVDCLPYGDDLIVYKEDALIAMQWIGGNDVFSFRYLPDEVEGLLAAGCVTDTPLGHVFLTPSYDVRLLRGGRSESIASGFMWQWLRTNMSTSYAKRSFLSYNPIANEVEIHIPTGANTACNKVLLWNCIDRTWGERDESAATCGTFGTMPSNVALGQRSIIGTTTPQIGLVDSGTTYFGAAYTSMVERTGISVDDPESVKNLQGTRWQDDGTAGATSTVYHGSAMTADGAVTYTSGSTHTLGTTNWLNARATGGRYMAIKRSTTGAIGKNRSVDIDFTTSGSR